QLSSVVQLLRGDLHTQAELRFQQIVQFFGQSRLVFALEFRCFHVSPLLLADLTDNERGRQRQLCCSQAERFTCQAFIHTIHLVQHFAWTNLGDVVFRITFTVTHTDFGRFIRNRLIREDTNPDTTATFDVTGHRATCSLDLTSRDTTTTNCLQTEFTERHGSTGAMRNTGITAFLLFTIFSACWLQHDYSPAFSAGAASAPSGFRARTRLAAGRLPGFPSSRRGPRRRLSSSAGVSMTGASPLAKRSPL